MQMDPELGSLEYVGNFQRFETPKTIDNITKWMNDSFKALKVQHSDFNQLSADGAANSIGSIAEYEALARTSRPNNVDVDICISHQNQRSGGLASGTLDFAVPENQELGDLLNKNHLIQTFISRSTGRMATYKGVQRKKRRNPMLNPNPGNVTRWDSWLTEVERSNLIMGDITSTIKLLLADGGSDQDLEDKESVTLTDEEKMILRQYEAAALPATVLSKFTQDNDQAWSYVLFYLMRTLQVCRSGVFVMHRGTSDNLAPCDLCFHVILSHIFLCFRHITCSWLRAF